MDGNRYEYGPTVKAPPDVAAWAQLEALEGALAKSAQGKHPAVTAKHNIESFPAIEARFVRFTITRSSNVQPCIDELEIFAGSENLALASKGAKASSAGDFKHPQHKLAHINDGQYGNAKSWIAARNTGWVQIELPKSARINRIEWARDRQGKNGDRVPIGYRIEAGLKEGEWKVIASSKGRQPFKGGQLAKKLDELKKRFTSTRWHGTCPNRAKQQFSCAVNTIVPWAKHSSLQSPRSWAPWPRMPHAIVSVSPGGSPPARILSSRASS